MIVLAIIMLFGPKKLPEIAKNIKNGMQHVRKAQSQFNAQINNLKTELDDTITDITDEKSVKNADKNSDKKINKSHKDK